MKGNRIFERFGFNLPEQHHNNRGLKLIKDVENWHFEAQAADWVNPDTGEVLTGYFPSLELTHLLNNCINDECS
jgi:hypothetical protein